MPSSPHRGEPASLPQMGLFAEPADLAPQRPPAANLQELRQRVMPAPRRKLPAQREQDTLPAWHPGESVPAPMLERTEEDAEPKSRRIWSVADLVALVRGHLEQTWPDLWVHGEISNLRTAPSGHLYFTLKDGESQLPAVLFRRQAQLLRFRPEDGLEVLLRGKISIYEQRGQLQLIAAHLEPVGAGSLQIAFEQLKARLAEEGLFAPERKKALPAYPRCVGIVTSPSGAVIRDFLNVAARRHAALDVLLYPALVQGASAAAEVAAGIAYFNQERSVEVIVIARGGGSLEDLAPFNTEILARAIADSALPVVSAIGHETDFTIADFVADLRAATPSAAAELITAAQHRVEEQVAEFGERLVRACRYRLLVARQGWSGLVMEAVEARLVDGLNRREQRVDSLRYQMESAMRTHVRMGSARAAGVSMDRALAGLMNGIHGSLRSVEVLEFRLRAACARSFTDRKERLRAAAAAAARHEPGYRLKMAVTQLAELETGLLRKSQESLRSARLRCRSAELQLFGAADRQLRAPRKQWDSLTAKLDTLSPLAVLSRGYALVFDREGNLVKRASAVSAGDLLTMRLGEGTLQGRVEKTSAGEA